MFWIIAIDRVGFSSAEYIDRDAKRVNGKVQRTTVWQRAKRFSTEAAANSRRVTLLNNSNLLPDDTFDVRVVPVTKAKQ